MKTHVAVYEEGLFDFYMCYTCCYKNITICILKQCTCIYLPPTLLSFLSVGDWLTRDGPGLELSSIFSQSCGRFPVLFI